MEIWNARFRRELQRWIWPQLQVWSPGYQDRSIATQRYLKLPSAPELFLVAEGPDSSVVAYACGTACHGSSLTHESMSSHDPEGSTLALHSVCVAAEHRRQGLATR